MSNGEKKRLAILGSTGSIGRQTLAVVRVSPDKFSIVALCAGYNLELLAKQVREFSPQFIAYASRDKKLPEYTDAKYERLTSEEIVSLDEVDIVVMATSGRAGLIPTLTALRAGKTVALASKEALVMAGETILKEAKKAGARILPVDSEHSAIWQCLSGEKNKPARLILTASGGPFRGYTKAQLEKVTVDEALRHPSWHMGKKITIDSATLMNKGLEVMEAHHLFNIPFEKISVLVHPQSIIHAMVEFNDGAVKALMSYPDMRLTIQYALTYPERLFNPELPRLDFRNVASLTFEPPDLENFPCLSLAVEAGKRSGTYPAVLAGADEIAVELFLKRRIGFTDIPHLVEKALSQHQNIPSPTIDEIIAADNWARGKVKELTRGDKCC